VKTLAAIHRVAMREFRRIGTRSSLYGLMIIAPLLVFPLLAGIYQPRVVKDIPVAICDLDHSELSRTITRMLESTRSLKIVASVASEAEIREGLRSGRLQGGFILPAELESRMKGGLPATVVVYKNAANIIIGNLIYRDAATVLRTVSAGVLLKKLRARGMTEDQALHAINPIRLDVYSLFNPGYNYSNFLVATLLPMVLQMLIMLAGASVCNAEYREGTAGELFAAAGGRALPLVVGKALPHVLIHSITLIGTYVLLFPLFGIPVNGSLLVAIVFSVYFVMAALLPTLLVSFLIRDPQFSTEIAVFVSTPAFLFSGETFPLMAMPALYQVIAQALPFTHFLTGFIKIQQYGAPVSFLLPEWAALSLFIWVPFTVLLIAVKRRGADWSAPREEAALA
jgi:ABC-2 type transport system permease protein